MNETIRSPEVVVVGGGPAGLMAATVLVRDGIRVSLYDRMPTVGRKFLVAGRGGLNLTHGEPLDLLITRYADRAEKLAPHIRAFPPAAVRAWAAALGVDTFVGTSGRVFPSDMKAARLLRAWVHELRGAGVRFHGRHRFVGFDGNEGPSVVFEYGEDSVRVAADAVILALGGASWSRLGSDGKWVPVLEGAGVSVRPLVPSNVGFLADWSPGLVERAAGHPLKNVAVRCGEHIARGEIMLTAYGVEGQVVYALSRVLREEVTGHGRIAIHVDLKPDVPEASLAARLDKPRGKASFATWLKRTTKLAGPIPALLREVAPDDETLRSPAALAALLKAVPITLTGMRPIDEAISTAGGVDFDALDESLMLRVRPGVFVAGEMVDFEAPTGGYLLQGAMSTGHAAGVSAAAWVRREAHA